MGCICSCFRVSEEEERDEVVVSNSQNCPLFSYLTQIFKKGTDITATEVGTNTPQETLLENSSSSGNLELQGVAVVRNGAGLSPLQVEHRPPEGHNVQVKGTDIATPEVSTNTPQNSSSARNLELQGHVAVQGNGAGSAPLKLKHGPPEGHNVQGNLCSKSKDIASGISKDTKAEALRFASPVHVSSEKVETEYKEDFCSTRDEVECPTCLEEYTDENPMITSKCNHHFHLGCIYEWMERSSACPMCFEEMKFVENI